MVWYHKLWYVPPWLSKLSRSSLVSLLWSLGKTKFAAGTTKADLLEEAQSLIDTLLGCPVVWEGVGGAEAPLEVPPPPGL